MGLGGSGAPSSQSACIKVGALRRASAGMQPGSSGMKSGGDASSMFTPRRCLSAGSARSSSSASGSKRKSTSIVVSRQPLSTAVSRRSDRSRTRPRATRPSSRASARMRGSSTGGRMLGRPREADDPADERVDGCGLRDPVLRVARRDGVKGAPRCRPGRQSPSPAAVVLPSRPTRKLRFPCQQQDRQARAHQFVAGRFAGTSLMCEW